MPTTIYDSSLITQRRRDKTISGSFINRIQNITNPTTGSAPILGISEQSIINTVNTGKMSEYRKNDGGCTEVSAGCPCNPVTIPIPVTSSSLLANWATIFAQTNGATTTISIVPQGVDTDNNGNIYISGYYISIENPVTIFNVNGNSQSPSAITLPITTNFSSFLLKYNSSGIAQWATNLPNNISQGGPGFYPLSQNVTIKNNNIYMSGSYSLGSSVPVNNANGNSQIASGITLLSTTSSDTFLIKYNLDGLAEWATVIKASGIDGSTSVDVDSLNNVYICGFFNGSNPTQIYNASGLTQALSSVALNVATSSNAAYLVKYNYLGQAQWATYFDGTANERAISIALDSLNNVYITGNYASTLLVTLQNANGNSQSPSSVTLPSTGGGVDPFLIKYNSSGQVVWATFSNALGTDTALKVAVDSLNNVYIAGNYASTLLVTLQNANGNSQSPSSVTLPATSVTICYIIKYNSSGQVQWATYVSGSVFAQTISLASDNNNNIYLAGDYGSFTEAFIYNANGNSQSLSIFRLPSTPIAQTTYLIKFNSQGTVINATVFTNNNQSVTANSIVVNSNNIYIIGRYNSSTQVIINNNIQTTISPSSVSLLPVNYNVLFGSTDGFLVNYINF
jgi:hypothetical protein